VRAPVSSSRRASTVTSTSTAARGPSPAEDSEDLQAHGLPHLLYTVQHLDTRADAMMDLLLNWADQALAAPASAGVATVGWLSLHAAVQSWLLLYLARFALHMGYRGLVPPHASTHERHAVLATEPTTAQQSAHAALAIVRKMNAGATRGNDARNARSRRCFHTSIHLIALLGLSVSRRSGTDIDDDEQALLDAALREVIVTTTHNGDGTAEDAVDSPAHVALRDTLLSEAHLHLGRSALAARQWDTACDSFEDGHRLAAAVYAELSTPQQQHVAQRNVATWSARIVDEHMEGLISAQEGRGDGATAMALLRDLLSARIARCGCDAAGRPLWSSSAARTAIRIAAGDLDVVTRDVRNAAQSLHDGEAQDAAQATELERSLTERLQAVTASIDLCMDEVQRSILADVPAEDGDTWDAVIDTALKIRPRNDVAKSPVRFVL
jgi:hypothetical protein